MKEILDDVIQYLRREGTADTLKQIEAALGQPSLMFLLRKLTGKMVFFEKCLPVELRTDYGWHHDVRQFFLLCPDIRQLLTLQDDSVDYHPTVSEGEKLEIAELLVKKDNFPRSPPYYIVDEQ
jgi:hypothetical protein